MTHRRLRLARIAAVAALAAAGVAAGGPSSTAVCRTPRPAQPGDTKVPAAGTTARSGGSWSGKSGAYVGAENGSGYVFADGSSDGVVVVAGAGASVSAHFTAGPGGESHCLQSGG